MKGKFDWFVDDARFRMAMREAIASKGAIPRWALLDLVRSPDFESLLKEALSHFESLPSNDGEEQYSQPHFSALGQHKAIQYSLEEILEQRATAAAILKNIRWDHLADFVKQLFSDNSDDADGRERSKKIPATLALLLTAVTGGAVTDAVYTRKQVTEVLQYRASIESRISDEQRRQFTDQIQRLSEEQRKVNEAWSKLVDQQIKQQEETNKQYVESVTLMRSELMTTRQEFEAHLKESVEQISKKVEETAVKKTEERIINEHLSDQLKSEITSQINNGFKQVSEDIKNGKPASVCSTCCGTAPTCQPANKDSAAPNDPAKAPVIKAYLPVPDKRAGGGSQLISTVFVTLDSKPKTADILYPVSAEGVSTCKVSLQGAQTGVTGKVVSCMAEPITPMENRGFSLTSKQTNQWVFFPEIYAYVRLERSQGFLNRKQDGWRVKLRAAQYFPAEIARK